MEAEKTHKYSKVWLTALLAVLLLAGTQAQAATLSVGGTLFPVPSEPDPVGATQLFTTGPVAFASPGAFSGTLTSTVYNNDSSNPFGLDRMTFVYQLSNDATSPNAIARMSMDSYTGFSTDASFQTGTGLAPTFVDRLLSSTIGWGFSQIGPGPLAPGQTSAMLVIQTDAPAFLVNSAAVIDSGQVSGILALGPLVPEPASLGLLALSGLVLRRRR